MSINKTSKETMRKTFLPRVAKRIVLSLVSYHLTIDSFFRTKSANPNLSAGEKLLYPY